MSGVEAECRLLEHDATEDTELLLLLLLLDRCIIQELEDCHYCQSSNEQKVNAALMPPKRKTGPSADTVAPAKAIKRSKHCDTEHAGDAFTAEQITCPAITDHRLPFQDADFFYMPSVCTPQQTKSRFDALMAIDTCSLPRLQVCIQ